LCLCTDMHLCDALKVNRFGPIGTTLLKQEMKSLEAVADLFCRLRRKSPVTTTKSGRTDMMVRRRRAALLKDCATRSRDACCTMIRASLDCANGRSGAW